MGATYTLPHLFMGATFTITQLLSYHMGATLGADLRTSE
jgi:hypothetical protein